MIYEVYLRSQSCFPILKLVTQECGLKIKWKTIESPRIKFEQIGVMEIFWLIYYVDISNEIYLFAHFW